LTAIIKKAKRMEYDKLILNSHNKIKTTCNIINKESGRKNNSNNIHALDVDGKKIFDKKSIAETFNEYFVTIAEKIRKQTRYTHMHANNNDVDNHIQFIIHAFDNPFSNMENKYSTINFSKIFETVMLTRISTHFSKYNIPSSEQYDFRAALRTDDAIYKLTTEILISMNSKLAVGGIFL
jgi:hypothetical protein